jgi:hypothetical protein
MAARRERERRRPAQERRYQFGTPQTDLPPDEDELEAEEASVATVSKPAPATRADVRAGTRLPFSAYKAEYAYVLGDLRRVGLVIGSLLLILIVLFFILPH